MMRIGRTLPPAAAPLSWQDVASGFLGLCRGSRETERFGRELQAYFNKKHCFLVSSGKAALTLILLALKEANPERDQVLIPAFTCYSVPSAIVRAGLTVTLCDIDSATFDFDYRQLPGKLDNPRLLCVLPVHLFGLPADVERLKAQVRDPAVVIVEDAAQAMGGGDGGKMLGTFGDVGFFSLGRGKALSTVEGGVVLTDCDTLGRVLARKVEALNRYSGGEIIRLCFYALALTVLTRPALFWLPKALPFFRLGETIYDPHFPMRRMTEFQAGLARNWRRKLDALLATRRAAVVEWLRLFPSPLLPMNATTPPALLRFPVLMANPESARVVLAGGAHQGLGLAPSYPTAVNQIPGLAEEFSGQEFPAAKEMAQRVITLPVHGYVARTDITKIFALLSQVGDVRP